MRRTGREVRLDDRSRRRLASHLDQVRADAERLDHTVQVTSFGGAGTTALCDHLDARGVDLQRGPGHWPWKHRRRRPDPGAVPVGFRAVYLVGDPRDTILSLFRRGYQRGHYEALHEQAPPPDVARRIGDLEHFLAGGVDDFELADHVARWLAPHPGFPVLVVKYEALGPHWPDLADFIGIDVEPALLVHPRSSDWRAAPAEVRRQLDAMYGELASRLDSLPAVSRLDP